jgi:hypothetical protein
LHRNHTAVFVVLIVFFLFFIKEENNYGNYILTKSKFGKWSVIMVIINLILFVAGSLLPYKDGYTGIGIFIQNPLQAIITVLMLGVGITALAMALISIFKNKERSVLVFLAVILGLYNILGFFGTVINVFFNNQ